MVLPLLGASLLCSLLIIAVIGLHIVLEVVHKLCEIICDIFKYCLVSGPTDLPVASQTGVRRKG